MATTTPDGGLVWQLDYELDHFANWPDVRYDLCADETLAGGEYFDLLSYANDIRLPTPTLFKAISQAALHIDYPYNDRSWPIMSKRMVETLLSVRDFPHRTHPICVKKGEVMQNDCDLVGLQLTSYCDYFDWEQSVYKKGLTSGLVKSVREFVLRIPQEGFPPIFRLSASPTRLFVSNEARQALKDARVCGSAYLRLDFYKRTNYKGVDVPILASTG